MVRHADPSLDAAAMAAIYAPSVETGVASFEATPPDEAEMARRIEQGAREYPWLVAERDGAVAGYAYGTSHRSRAAYRWTVEVTVYVDAARRRSGVRVSRRKRSTVTRSNGISSWRSAIRAFMQFGDAGWS